MKIQWNAVTWYSKLLSIILFLGILPVLNFYIGVEYEQAVTALITPIEIIPSKASKNITSSISGTVVNCKTNPNNSSSSTCEPIAGEELTIRPMPSTDSQTMTVEQADTLPLNTYTTDLSGNYKIVTNPGQYQICVNDTNCISVLLQPKKSLTGVRLTMN